MASKEEVQAVKQRHSMRLLQEPGVHGVGVQKDAGDNYVLAVYVDPAKPETAARMPTELDGCPVKLVHTAPFEKQ